MQTDYFTRQLFILLFPLCISIMANAQPKRPKPINRISLYFAEQYFFDKKSVRNDGKLPENILFPENTVGKAMSIEYERVTRSGFMYGGGLIYGTRNYHLLVKNDISNFDPNAMNSLKGSVVETREKGSMNYIGYKLNVGYRKELNKNWALCGKIGYNAQFLLDGSRALTYAYCGYFDDNLHPKLQEIHSIINYYGRDPGSGKNASFFQFRRHFPFYYVIANAYIGTEYHNIPFRWIKNASIGLEMGRILADGADVMVIRSRQSVTTSSTNLAEMSRDVFIDRFLYIGLRAGISFWK